MANGANTVVARIGLDDSGFQQGVGKIQRSLKVIQSEFAAASSKLGDFGKSAECLKQKQDNLNKQLELQKQKVVALSKGYEESVEAKGEDAKATENLKIKLNYAQAELNKVENELKNVNNELEIQSSSWTKFGKAFDGVGSKMQTVGEGFSKVGSTLSKTVTAPLVAAGAGLLKIASDFDEANDTIRTGTGATGETLAALNDDFKAVYTTVNTSIDDASNAIADLNTRTGLSGESLQSLSAQMLRLAKITGEDINTLIPAATRMFQDAGISTEEYGTALDYTFKVSQNTGIGVSRLQELMTQFGGPLRQMGFDWQTTAAMLGKFEKEGVNTELVLGSLRIALGKMAKEGISEPNKALQEMITRIREAGTAGEANALALEMFGAKAGPDMAAAIREGRLNLDELLSSINASPETIEKAAKDTEDFSDKFIILKNKMAVALEPLGKKLIEAIENAMPAIERLIGSITKIVEKFNSLSPAQQDMIIKFAVLAAAIGPVVSIIGKVISVGGTMFSTFGSIATALGKAKAASGALGTAFTVLTSPVALIIGAIVGLIAIFVVLYKNNEDFRNSVNSTWASVKNIISGTIEGIKNGFHAFTAFASDIWYKSGENIKGIASATYNGIKTAIINPIVTAKEKVKEAVNAIIGFFQNIRLPEIRIPRIKLPHFRLNGEFSLSPPNVPRLSVEWYAKGGIFNRPSVIGVGEAGTEAVLPIDRLDDLMARAIEKVKGTASQSGGLTLHIENFINNSDKDIEQLAYELEFYKQRVSMAKGGS